MEAVEEEEEEKKQNGITCGMQAVMSPWNNFSMIKWVAPAMFSAMTVSEKSQYTYRILKRSPVWSF